MDRTVDVTIPVEPEAASALADTRNREAVGRLVSRVLRPRPGPSSLARAIAELTSTLSLRPTTRSVATAAAIDHLRCLSLVSAALKADSVPERALLRAEEVDGFALSAAVDAEIAAVDRRRFALTISLARRERILEILRVRPSGLSLRCG